MKDFGKIKRNRTPEAFLIDIIREMRVMKTTSDSTHYKYNNSIVFEYSPISRCIYVNYKLIWSVFEHKTDLYFGDISELVITTWNKYAVENGYERVRYCSYSECAWWNKIK